MCSKFRCVACSLVMLPESLISALNPKYTNLKVSRLSLMPCRRGNNSPLPGHDAWRLHVRFERGRRAAPHVRSQQNARHEAKTGHCSQGVGVRVGLPIWFRSLQSHVQNYSALRPYENSRTCIKHSSVRILVGLYSCQLFQADVATLCGQLFKLLCVSCRLQM